MILKIKHFDFKRNCIYIFLKKTPLFLLILTLFGMVSCTSKVNPNIKISPIKYPSSWNSKPAFIKNNDPVIAWWKQFHDPLLNKYVDDVARFNFDLRIAIARVDEERALRRGAESNLYPQISAQLKDSKYQLFNSNINASQQLPTSFFNNNSSINFFNMGFDATWEMDVWGKQRWNIIAAQENIEIANEYKRAVFITLISDLARNYMELRGAQSQMAILKSSIENQKNNLKLMHSRCQIGLSKKIDVINAQMLLDSMHSQLANIEAAIQAYAYNISVLTGHSPEVLSNDLLSAKQIPSPCDVIAIGLPADLIFKRPDIREAQLKLGLAIAAVGSAKADLYPSIKINGGLGFAKVKLGDLFNVTGGLWSIIPSLDFKIFDRRSLEAKLEANQAKVKEADAVLRKTVLNAIKDVETSINYLDAAKKTKADLESATLSSRKAYAMMKKAYQIGLKTQIDILDTEKIYLNNQSHLIDSKLQVNLRIINLYKVLGGGWRDNQSPKN